MSLAPIASQIAVLWPSGCNCGSGRHRQTGQTDSPFATRVSADKYRIESIRQLGVDTNWTCVQCKYCP